MNKLEKLQSFATKEDEEREQALKDLEEVIAKLEKHLRIIKEEETRTGDVAQAKVTTDLALDVLREGVKKIISNLTHK